MGVDAGDEVIVSPYTFIATASAVVTVGAVPVFADIDPQTLCIDPADVARKISPRTRAIMAVHIYGLPVDMDAVLALARRHGLLDSAAIPEYERNLGTARAVAAGAVRLGRPLVAAATLNRGERQRLLSADQSEDTAAWQALGYVYVAPAPGRATLDSAALRRWSAWLDRAIGSGELRESIDPVNHYFLRVLKCPEQLLEMSRAADSSRVDSVCNYR